MGKKPIDGHLGTSIRARRKLIGLTQADLAAAIGVTFQQVQKYETGVSTISQARLQQICDTMNLPQDFFAGGDGALVGKPAVIAPAEDPDAQQRFLMSGEGKRLVESFMRIGDARLRTHILDFIAAVARD